jgi:hypothetical protein
LKHSAFHTRVTFGAVVALVGFNFLLIPIATAYAQDADPEAKTKAPFSELKVKPSSLEFGQTNLSSGVATESKSFTVTDSGTASLSVTVGNPSSAAFTITKGAGQTLLQPKGELTVTVKFEPTAAGKVAGTIAVSSEATKGKTSASVKLTGKAKGTLPPTPTPTATATTTGSTPTATATATKTATPTATATVSAEHTIFITNFSGESVTAYPVTGNGNIAPTVNIDGSNPSLFEPSAATLDSKGNIYVANETGGPSGNGSVTVYAPGSNGNAMPIATISGPDTGLGSPDGIALDAADNIYVSNDCCLIVGGGAGSITEYPAGSNGDTAPSATITNIVFPGMANPTGIAVDKVSGNIFVASGGGGVSDVVEYAANSSGAATPIAIITGANTGLGTDETAFVATAGIALNPVNGNIYVAAVPGGVSGDSVILVYASSSNGNVEPTAAIEGAETGLYYPQDVALDSSGNIYVANSAGGPTGIGFVTVYPAASNGNVTPSATIAGSMTLLSAPYGIAVGP